MPRKRKVKNLDTGQEYESISQAAFVLGIYPQELQKAVTTNSNKFGRWLVLSPPCKGYPVRCVETGKDYPSAYAAAKDLGGYAFQVLRSAEKNSKTTINGQELTFQFTEEHRKHD